MFLLHRDKHSYHFLSTGWYEILEHYRALKPKDDGNELQHGLTKFPPLNCVTLSLVKAVPNKGPQ